MLLARPSGRRPQDDEASIAPAFRVQDVERDHGGVTLSSSVVGSGRRVVLLPWFSLDGSVMSAAFEPALGPIHGLQRSYLDLPGCGGSAPVAPTSDAIVETVIEHLEGLDGPTVLVGCSYGGYIAAAVTRRRPDLVSGLALVCSGVRITLADRTLPHVPRTVPLDWPVDVDPGVRSHLDLALASDDIAVATTVARLISSSRSDDAYLTELRETGYPVCDEDDPTQYDGPVLVASGRQDRICGYVDQFDALARYPHAGYLALDRAGHYLPFEQPDQFAAVLRSWLIAAGIDQPG